MICCCRIYAKCFIGNTVSLIVFTSHFCVLLECCEVDERSAQLHDEATREGDCLVIFFLFFYLLSYD